MAADPKKATDKKEAEAVEDDGAGKKKKKLLLIIGLAVGLVALSIGGTVVALKMLAPADKTEHAEADAEKEEAPLAPAIYYAMAPNFTINFTVQGRQRFLQAEITLMYRDPTIDPLLKLHMPAIRNGLVMLLSGKDFDNLQTPEGKETLRKEALDVVQGTLKKEQETLAAHAAKDGDDEEEDKKSDDKKEPAAVPNVEQVLFTNFVMQ